jgi:hypothetical protein
MTIQEAFAEFTESADFKEIAKKKTALGNKYRVYLMRFKNEELKAGAIVKWISGQGQ